MSLPLQDAMENRLLRQLHPDDYAAAAGDFERVPLAKGHLLFARNEPIGHAWFIARGLGSLVAVSPEGQQVEAGLFGRDGFTPTALVHGIDRAAYECVIQMPGEAYRIPIADLTRRMAALPTLRDVLLRYTETLTVQASYTALSNAVHQIDERLARWLLMSHDRSDSDELALTHEFLSIMLAVRRPSVTSALHVLEGNGFIRAERGWITIRDRDALQEFAGDAYGIPEAEYERLLGPLR